jgi:hypothetical protein
LLKPTKKEVVIECSSLSDEERKELETFLKSQPGVQDVRRRMRTKDRAFDRDTLGLFSQLLTYPGTSLWFSAKAWLNHFLLFCL